MTDSYTPRPTTIDRDAYEDAVRKIKEAERDLAYAVYGDNWRKYVTQDFLSTDPEVVMRSLTGCITSVFGLYRE